jgi:hypothetical protein
MLQIVRLPTIHAGDTVVTGEIDMKRVWWTLFMVGRWCTSGL